MNTNWLGYLFASSLGKRSTLGKVETVCWGVRTGLYCFPEIPSANSGKKITPNPIISSQGASG